MRAWRWAGVGAVLLFIAWAVFDIDWLRPPLQQWLSARSGRTVVIGHLAWRTGWPVRFVLTEFSVSNAGWGAAPELARARRAEVELALAPLLHGELVLPAVRLYTAQLSLERAADGRNNWTLVQRRTDGASRLTVRGLAVDEGDVDYHDARTGVQAHARVDALPTPLRAGSLTTGVTVRGRFRGEAFHAYAMTGDLLALRDADQPFAVVLALRIGATQFWADGTAVDLLHLARLDAAVEIAGPSLATLYPALKLVLPPSPPYRARGHLRLDDDVYRLDGLQARIGASDVAGYAVFTDRPPRPRLQAHVHSRALDVRDLGPAVGAAPAAAAARSPPPRRVLPDAPLNLERMGAMDAEVDWTAARLRLSDMLSVQDLRTRIALDDRRLTLAPLDFAFAGGTVAGTVALDGRASPTALDLALDLRRLRLDELLVGIDPQRQSGGRLGAQVRLAGRGSSLARALGTADGTVTAAMAGGQVSALVLAAASLNGGRLLRLLLGGDHPAAIRCGGVALVVRDGHADASQLVFDTEDVRIDGSAAIDLARERYSVRLAPQPKRPGILSLRAPVTVFGDFRSARVAVDEGAIVRGAAAAALAAVNPLVALLPLIETGPGEDSDCRAVLAPVRGAQRQAQVSGRAPPR